MKDIKPLSPLGQAALSYAMNAGLPVFPCYSLTDEGACVCDDANCGSPGKHPWTGIGGFHNATTAIDQIAEWWTEHPDANIGIPTGAVSGIDVVDLDLYKPDGTTLKTLCNGHRMPETPVTETGRGGLHYYFRYEEGRKAVAPAGVDWKSDGGYVIVPPSRGALQPYRWKVSPDDVDLAPLPEWLCREDKAPEAKIASPADWKAQRATVCRALKYVDPGLLRETWLRIGMAIHHASGGSDDGLTLWHSWSAGKLHDAQPDNYGGIEDIRTRWDSFGNNSGVTLGTLYQVAAENGFQYAPTLRFSDKAVKNDLPELPTASEFLQHTYPEAEFLIGPIQNQNIVLIHGPTGIGKTQLGAAIAKALGTGEPWLHWKVSRPCRLLFIDAELPPGVLQHRLRLHGVDTANVHILNAIELSGTLGQGSHLNLADPHWQEIVWAYMTRYRSESVLVDNVMSAVSVPGTSMSSDEFWKPVYDLSLKWRGAGLTSIWMDHSNSAGSIFGTKTKTWNADLVVKLSLPDDHDPEEGCRFIVEYEKHRGLLGEMVRGFTAWMDTPELNLSDMSGETKWDFSWVTDTRQEEVWALFASHVPVPKIIAKTKVPKTTVHRWISIGKRLGKC